MGEGWLGSHHPLFPTLAQLPRKPGLGYLWPGVLTLLNGDRFYSETWSCEI